MNVLIEKMRKAREIRVPVAQHTFIALRPTELEMSEMRNQTRGRAILPFVIGWEGVKELDLIPGGGPDPVPFNADVAAEWLIDRIDLLGPLVDGVFEAYEQHGKKREAAAKN